MLPFVPPVVSLSLILAVAAIVVEIEVNVDDVGIIVVVVSMSFSSCIKSHEPKTQRKIDHFHKKKQQNKKKCRNVHVQLACTFRNKKTHTQKKT